MREIPTKRKPGTYPLGKIRPENTLLRKWERIREHNNPQLTQEDHKEKRNPSLEYHQQIQQEIQMQLEAHNPETSQERNQRQVAQHREQDKENAQGKERKRKKNIPR